MSESPFVPFYTSDFLAGTSGMTAATKGVYITLLCLMYETEGPLPQKWDALARRCGCTLPAFKKAISDLEDDGKITVTEAGLWSEKCEKHIAQRRERSDSAKAAAKKRWGKTVGKQCYDGANASSEQCKPEPQLIKREAKASPKKGTRLQQDWTLPRDWGEWALNEGWPEAGIRTEAAKFRDFWVSKPGKDATKLDWLATWRNWMRNSKTPKISAINGGHNDGQGSKSHRRMQAFIAGARGTG